MVFFNDPVPCPDPAERAVKMAMREVTGTLIADWRERGRDLGFGAGIAQGYASLGQIGSPNAPATLRSAPCAMLRLGSALKPRTARFCSANARSSD
jgi:hypothetical protein